MNLYNEFSNKKVSVNINQIENCTSNNKMVILYD